MWKSWIPTSSVFAGASSIPGLRGELPALVTWSSKLGVMGLEIGFPRKVGIPLGRQDHAHSHTHAVIVTDGWPDEAAQSRASSQAPSGTGIRVKPEKPVGCANQ